MTEHEVETTQGPARVHLRRPPTSAGLPTGTLLLGHGAGGGIGAPDLLVAQAAALRSGWVVGLVEQPWRVAGKRVASAPPRLDDAWISIVGSMRSGRGALPEPFVFGGRSAGARVACRLAGPLEAAGVLALAFPLHPPGRPERSRIAELTAAIAAGPVLVVQGERDPFGSGADVRSAVEQWRPRADRAAYTVLDVPGDHGLKAVAGPASAPIADFLRGVASAR